MCSSNHSFHGVPCDGSQLNQNNNQQRHNAAGDLADMVRAISTTGGDGGNTCGRPYFLDNYSTTASCWKHFQPSSSSSSSDTTTLMDHHRRAADQDQEAADQLYVPFSFRGQHKLDDAEHQYYDHNHDVGFFNSDDPFSSSVIRDPLFQHGEDNQQDIMMMMNGSSSRNYLHYYSNSGGTNNMNMDSHLLPSSLAHAAPDPPATNMMMLMPAVKSKQTSKEIRSAEVSLLGHDQHELQASYSQQAEEVARAGAAAPNSLPNNKQPAPIISTQKEVSCCGIGTPDAFSNLSVNKGCPSGTNSSPRMPAAIKRRKSLAKKVVCIPAPAPANSRPGGEVVPSDLWAWRKYGQKPIKGSPYPRGYYRCSGSKGCSARKQVERSRTDPNMLVLTYTSEHNHPWPTQRNALAGSTRSQASSKNSNNKVPAAASPVYMKSLFEPQQCAMPTDQGTEEGTDNQLMKHNNDDPHTIRCRKNERMCNHQITRTIHRPQISMMHPAECYKKVEQSSQQDDFFAELGEIVKKDMALRSFAD